MLAIGILLYDDGYLHLAVRMYIRSPLFIVIRVLNHILGDIFASVGTTERHNFA